MTAAVHLDLFSGIGGIALAARWAGFHTALFCEIDKFCTKVLTKHWPRVPIHGDIRTLTQATLQEHGIERVTLLTGGFPCQPFSCAGKRKGKADDRYLWPEMLRVIHECRPTWIVGENVAGFVRLALDQVLADLEGEGYQCRAFLVPACGVGAPHKRERCFVVARDTHGGIQDTQSTLPDQQNAQSSRVRSDVPDTNSRGIASHAHQRPEHQQEGRSQKFVSGTGLRRSHDWESREVTPRVCRVSDGIPRRLDRLRGLGNAVVPQQIYPILQAIACMEQRS